MSRPFDPATPATYEDWKREDEYHKSFLLEPDEALEYALANSEANGLPDIAVTPAQGKYLKLLALSVGAKRILELGTLGGYSTIWLARALPEGGELITCEYVQKHADVARQNLEHADLTSKVKIVVGAATDTLAKMDPSELFDFIFVDADKPNYPTYFKRCRSLMRKGGVVFVDNVIRRGGVSNLAIKDDPRINGVREMLEVVKQDKGMDATTIGTVGEKGYDGFMYAVRLD
ncbi:S-adenosyl-L-methionine-dependent methyltransferase [Gloeophyllum trabeum ATCC 11539]|uniref:S-adenosyl-L-methionine-dependent methyltransferase n=1 Tax=Gloeophyllum trabeum (strain ATCC 11539 / FP-39264 / Madison 617) TaxID=670483 RepID=S7RN88_GLOTA|nr:S-adenosyl-L-methionine-dependent methyltransferase [Gloeophyllum trabeum ATCC 11539]EPQ54224.1 S-adenosyl-L-methionine-dependent methyltransferase [Gloeophyllum trabeum ATCC 11539]